VHARIVVVLGSFVELQEVVVVRTNPLGRVDGAGDQVFIDLAARQRHRRCAQLGHDVAAEARNTHLQTRAGRQRVDFLVEPAAHLHAGVAAGQPFRPNSPQARPTAPDRRRTSSRRRALGVGQAERHSGERSPARVLAFPVVVGADVGLALPEATSSNESNAPTRSPAAKYCTVDAAFGQLFDAGSEALGAEMPRPGKSRGQVDTMTNSLRAWAIAGNARKSGIT
jgi:hypothetical protein